MIAWLLAAALAAPVGTGWRHDGRAVVADATPPATPAAPRWQTPLPAWGNATPVLFGALLCTTAEPTWVVCLDAATGAERWRATNDRLDTLTGPARAAKEAELAQAPALEAAVREALVEMSRLRREARRAEDAAAHAAQVAAISATLDARKAELDALAPWRTPEDHDIIGYASATPTTDGRSLYVQTGNGVVSAFAPDGARRWSTWVGPEVRPMRGYDFGSVSSPRVVGDRLIVPHGHLQALDPATGRVVWTDDAVWDHYGTPAVATVGGTDLVLTPDGRALRVTDGVEVARDLGNILYVGPVADGDRVYYVGGRGTVPGGTVSPWRAVRLVPDGGRVRGELLWERPAPDRVRLYTAPVAHDGRLYVVLLDNTFTVLDTATGAVRSEQTLGGFPADLPSKVEVYANMVVAGGRLWLTWKPGVLAALTLGDRPEVAWMGRLPEPTRATPVFRGPDLWVRTLQGISAWR